MSTFTLATSVSLREPDVAISPRRIGHQSALFLIGIVLLTAIPVVPGKLLLLELACFAGLPLLLVSVVYDSRLGVLVLVTVSWAFGLVMADLAHGFGLRASKPLAVTFTIVLLGAALIRVVDGDPARLRTLIAALGIGMAINQIAFPDEALPSAARLWKYGIGIPISIAVLALCDLPWRNGVRLPTFVALIALACVDIAADFRSLAMLKLCTIAVYLAASGQAKRLRGVTAVLLAVVLCALLGLGFFSAARAGWLGQRSADQFRDTSLDVYSIIVNARPELLQSLYLIAQRPLTGYGSVPDLDTAAFVSSLSFLNEHGVVIDANVRRYLFTKSDPGVAAHSMALDSIVQAGILALPFWVYLWFVAIRRAVTAIRLRASPLTMFWTLLVLVDSLFNPLFWPYHVLLAAYLPLVLLPLPTREGAQR